ncbi:MAG: hypothetical protein HKL88_04485 [Bacteroidia bacterium]|nr:hypothetical protein [Bacteroidia bacterium]
MKFTNELRQIIQKELDEPSDEFTKYFAKIVYPSHVTSRILEQFKGLVKKTFSQYINDEINERLKSALRKQEQDEKQKAIIEQQNLETENIPTDEEIELYMIVKAICRAKVEGARINYREARGHQYFSILLDDSQRTPICRFYSNDHKKQIGLIDAEKKVESVVDINSLDDVYRYSEHFLKAVDCYIKPTANIAN